MVRFDNIKWNKGAFLPREIFMLSGLSEEYNETDNLLSFTLESGDVLLAVKSQIGKEPHPMIKIAGCSSWFTDDTNGYYVTGFDVKNKEFFQIIS